MPLSKEMQEGVKGVRGFGCALKCAGGVGVGHAGMLLQGGEWRRGPSSGLSPLRPWRRGISSRD